MLKRFAWLFCLIILTACQPGSTSSSPQSFNIEAVNFEPLPFEETVIVHQRINNCDGSSPTVTYTRSLAQEQTLFFEVQVEGGGLIKGTPIPTILETQLEAKVMAGLSTSKKDTGMQEVSIPLVTPEGQVRNYSITWKETRKKGTVTVRSGNNETAEVGFVKILSIELFDRTSEITKCTEVPLSNTKPEVTPAVLGEEATAVPKAQSNSTLSESEINNIFGENNWFCFPDRKDAIAIRKIPNLVVQSPVVKIDTYQGSYKLGTSPAANIGGTAWLSLQVPRESCPASQTPALEQWDIQSRAAQFGFTKTEFDNLFGVANWKCLSDIDYAITVMAFPPGFTIDYPFSAIDQDDNRYGVGEAAKAGRLGTVWFVGQIPKSECR